MSVFWITVVVRVPGLSSYRTRQMPDDLLALLPAFGELVTSRPFQKAGSLAISFRLGYVPTKSFRDRVVDREGLFFVRSLEISAIRTRLL